jgi:hypothetical protein
MRHNVAITDLWGEKLVVRWRSLPPRVMWTQRTMVLKREPPPGKYRIRKSKRGWADANEIYMYPPKFRKKSLDWTPGDAYLVLEGRNES